MLRCVSSYFYANFSEVRPNTHLRHNVQAAVSTLQLLGRAYGSMGGGVKMSMQYKGYWT